MQLGYKLNALSHQVVHTTTVISCENHGEVNKNLLCYEYLI